jgi:hypothetical protein
MDGHQYLPIVTLGGFKPLQATPRGLPEVPASVKPGQAVHRGRQRAGVAGSSLGPHGWPSVPPNSQLGGFEPLQATPRWLPEVPASVKPGQAVHRGRQRAGVAGSSLGPHGWPSVPPNSQLGGLSRCRPLPVGCRKSPDLCKARPRSTLEQLDAKPSDFSNSMIADPVTPSYYPSGEQSLLFVSFRWGSMEPVEGIQTYFWCLQLVGRLLCSAVSMRMFADVCALLGGPHPPRVQATSASYRWGCMEHVEGIRT